LTGPRVQAQDRVEFRQNIREVEQTQMQPHQRLNALEEEQIRINRRLIGGRGKFGSISSIFWNHENFIASMDA
jgi:hypothetical protein